MIQAFDTAEVMGLQIAALTGKGGGDLTDPSKPAFGTYIGRSLEHDGVLRIQEMHITLGQSLCGALEIELGLAEG